MRKSPSNILWLAVSTIVLCVTGCGSPHGTVKVTGQVTVDGQPPPGPGRLTFNVVEPASGFPNRPAMAKFDTDGKFAATTFDPGDGVLPGSYTISIECYETPPNMEGKPEKSYIAAKYMNGETSGYELDVSPGSRPIEFNVELSSE